MNYIHLTYYVVMFDLAILILSSGLGLFWFNRLKPGLQHLTVYLVGISVIEIISKLYVFQIVSGSNLWLAHIYVPFEFLILSRMYLEILQLPKKRAKILNRYVWVLGTATIVYSAYLLFGGAYLSAENFQLYSKVVVNGSIVVYSIALLVRALLNPGELGEVKSFLPINSAMLLYFSGSFFIFLTFTYLVQSGLEKSILIWLTNVLLSLILHLVCLFVLWQKDSRYPKN